MLARTPRPIVLPGGHPNAGVEATYRRLLVSEIERMQASLVYWLGAAYRANEPEMAADDSPAATISRAMGELTRRWTREFDRLARRAGPEFVKKTRRHAEQSFADRLRKAGFTVRFQISKRVEDVTAAAVAENVALIKSIAAQHLTQVEGLVMRSVSSGRDLHQLSTDLQQQLGVTKRRAVLIARDQNAKATAAVDRARQTELGIQKARWRHSHAGKVPRPSHVDMNGQVYDISKGMWDRDEKKWIHPGELINCRCVSMPIIEGFS